ncbi:MAG: ethylbenzene dehydrogenase-related protein, partial [Planctomycetota bacterium]
RYGSPQTYEVIEPDVLTVTYKTAQVDLQEDDISVGIWQDIPALELNLYHQVSERPWPKGHTPSINVQAFHNGKDIYFKMTWEDEQADTTISVDRFVDGCAIAVPIDRNAPVRSIMMGFSSPVNIWHWQADKNLQYWDKQTNVPSVDTDFTYPFEEQEILSVIIPELTSAVSDLVAQRAGSLTRKDTQKVQGRGSWQSGIWSVILKRSLTTDDMQSDCQFPIGACSATFAVWDGDQQDRGGRKSMSEWVTLDIEQSQEQSSADKNTAAEVSWIDKISSFSLLSSAYGANSNNQSAQIESEPRLITIQAKRFEYTPSEITIQKGEVITLRLESLDVTHGLYLDAYGIDIKARPGLIGKATFIADKPGRFTFRCSETCGEFHPYMIGFMEVTPNSQFHLFVVTIGLAFIAIVCVILFAGKKIEKVEKNEPEE